MRPVSRHGDGLGLLQHLALGPQQQQGERQRDPHHRQRPALVLHRLRMDQVADGLLADQRGGCEHQAGLQQAGEGLALAMAVAVLAVGRRGGVADGKIGGESRDDIEPGVRQRSQHRHRSGSQPGRQLDGRQDQCGRHREARDPARERGGLGDRHAAGMSFVVVV